ncbi:efflux RND transporter periplasmic adaptor subunit [Echinicola sp. CAU 1574]|uniref:Efflux RND transporter periplasmic adaptor subunit n=1 Tax=Echinicola arenosa TaxID=2774144 RepID=A0ABR9APV8_9BACT|nr:efflux RND transporter periplasmic adaptor subunit [Echinicola arenosa]MBD8490826.1 efflux RND transporter periplasmic adaptor subunit [Echinicola arenosa]
MKKFLYAVLMAGIAGFVSSCGSEANTQANSQPAAVAVKAATVKSEHVTGLDVYPGTVVPLNEIEIRPQVSGYINKIFIKDGQEVNKGQKLYEIDRSKYQAAYEQAKANLKSAKANLVRVKRDLERYEALDAKEAIAKQQLDYAKADILTAESQVASAEAQVKSTETDYNYSVIKAPFAGTVGISQVRLGAQVSAGQTLLNSLSSDDPVLVDFVINEKSIRRFSKMMKEENLPDSTFTIRFNKNDIYGHHGTLTTIDRAVGRQSGTINLRVEFPNPEKELVPGMTVNLQVLNQDIGEQVTIPFKSVTEQMGEYFVYVIDNENTVHQQNIVLGSKAGADIVVREGLKPGQKIVVEGIQKLREGAKVSTVAPAQQSK